MKLKSLLWLGLNIIFGAFFLLQLLDSGINYAYAGRILPHLSIAGIDVGGLTSSEAWSRISSSLNSFAATPVILHSGNFIIEQKVSALGFSTNRQVALQPLFDFGQKGWLVPRVADKMTALLGPKNLPVGWTLNETTLRDFIENKLSPRLEVKGSDAQVKVVGKSVRLEPAVTGVMIDRVALAQTLEQTLGQLSPTPVLISLVTQEPRVSNEAALQAQNIITTTIIKPLTLKAGFNTFTMSENDLWDMVQAVPDSQGKLTASLDETKLRIFLQGLASTVNQELQNPVLVIKNNRAVTFVPPQNEVRLLINESVQKIEAAATSDQREVELITSEKAPSGDLASTNNLGINALVARGTSNFAGSPPNRRHNIKVGLARFDGIIVAPGETFSFDQALGPVNASAGYLPELVIKGDSTVPEFGGGLCQISTTAFRAILNGGYPVKERVNHSYRVVYYEPAGSDATIYPPNPDLKFTNDTPGAILMHTYQKGDNAYFDFYGTSMPRKVVLDGPHILKTTGYPAPVYVETSSLAPGVIKQIDRAHQGADTILTQYVYDEQGGLIRKQEFKSHYIPWPSKFLVGAAAAPKVETDLKQTPPPLEQTEGLTTGTSTS